MDLINLTNKAIAITIITIITIKIMYPHKYKHNKIQMERQQLLRLQLQEVLMDLLVLKDKFQHLVDNKITNQMFKIQSKQFKIKMELGQLLKKQ